MFFQLEGILFYFYGGEKEEERLRGMAVNGCERVVLDQCTFFRYVRKPYKHVLDMIQKQQLAHAHVLDQHSGVHHVIQWLAEPHLVTKLEVIIFFISLSHCYANILAQSSLRFCVFSLSY